jgi:uncharacterized protein (TIGR03435 family)
MRVYALTVAKAGARLRATSAGTPGYFRPGKGALEGEAVTMASFVQFLGGSLGESVVDKTGIEGKYSIRLKWAPTESEPGYTPNAHDNDPDGASIFTAIQEQLGLKLEATKGSVDALIIDHVDRPSAN